MRNFYKVLGIRSTADGGRIKSAFRRRAKAVHPDLNPGNAGAETRFKELLQAYEVLRDAKARATYDAFLARRRSQAWRNFAHSAAVMATTFVLTTGSAIFVLGQQGITVHSQTWQIATAWLTSVQVEAPLPTTQDVAAATTKPTAPTAGKGHRAGTRSHASAAPARAPSAARRHKAPAPDAVADAQGSRPPAAPDTRWTPADDAPMYGLGAKGLQ